MQKPHLNPPCAFGIPAPLVGFQDTVKILPVLFFLCLTYGYGFYPCVVSASGDTGYAAHLQYGQMPFRPADEEMDELKCRRRLIHQDFTCFPNVLTDEIFYKLHFLPEVFHLSPQLPSLISRIHWGIGIVIRRRTAWFVTAAEPALLFKLFFYMHPDTIHPVIPKYIQG